MKYSDLGPEIRAQLVARGLPADADEEATRNWVEQKLPQLTQLFAFIDVVYKESDRGCVICATAFIDDALEGALRVFLSESSKASKSVLDSLLTRRPMPPLGSLAVRTKMARALGFIDDRIMASLDGMRPMRNDAAHLAVPFSFENYEIEPMLETLSRKEQAYLTMIGMLRDEQPGRWPPKRRHFEIAACSIFFRLTKIRTQPNFYAEIFKIGGSLSHFGPFDQLYDDFMAYSKTLPESGSSDESNSTAQK